MPTDRTPAYARIAAEIRSRIESGELQPGDNLEPLRRAAEIWGVNLHTARHAYVELAREGLVEMRRRRGTTVLGDQEAGRDGDGGPEREDESLDHYLGRLLSTAVERYGLGPAEIAERFQRVANAYGALPPEVGVLECSRHQAEDLARQLTAEYRVRAQPLVLGEIESLPRGPIVATYFHYNEVRRRWPQRFQEMVFVPIHPDPALEQKLLARKKGRRLTVTVCEWDEPTAGAVAGDLSRLLGEDSFRLERRTVSEASEVLRGRGRSPVLFPPRVWAELAPALRDHPRALQVRYLFDREELARHAQERGWRPRLRAVERRTG